MEDYNDYEEIPDEELWEDGEINRTQLKEKIYHRVIEEGDWIVMRKKDKLPIYKVLIESTNIEAYMIEAGSKEDAEETYMEGDVLYTKPKQDEIISLEIIEEWV